MRSSNLRISSLEICFLLDGAKFKQLFYFYSKDRLTAPIAMLSLRCAGVS